MDSTVYRRMILVVISTSTIGGCLDRIPSFGKQGFLLGVLTVTNHTTETLDFIVRLVRGDTVDYDGVVEVPANEYVNIDPTWPDAPAEFTLTYGVDENNLFSIDLTADDDQSSEDDCMFVDIWMAPRDDQPRVTISPADEHPFDVDCQ